MLPAIKLDAVNLSGAAATNFAFEDPNNIGFSGTPLIADFEGDTKAEIIASTKDGRIFAIDGATGKIVAGFPLAGGTNINSIPVLFVDNGKASLASLNGEGNLSAWKIGETAGKFYWSSNNAEF